jgi:hypothetical protein
MGIQRLATTRRTAADHMLLIMPFQVKVAKRYYYIVQKKLSLSMKTWDIDKQWEPLL